MSYNSFANCSVDSNQTLHSPVSTTFLAAEALSSRFGANMSPAEATSSSLGLSGMSYPTDDAERTMEGRSVDEVVSLILGRTDNAYPSARMYLASREPADLTTLYASLHAYDLELYATTLEFLLEESDTAKPHTVQEGLRTAALTRALYWIEYHYLSPSKAESAWYRYQRAAAQRAASRRQLRADADERQSQGKEETSDWVCSYGQFN